MNALQITWFFIAGLLPAAGIALFVMVRLGLQSRTTNVAPLMGRVVPRGPTKRPARNASDRSPTSHHSPAQEPNWAGG